MYIDETRVLILTYLDTQYFVRLGRHHLWTAWFRAEFIKREAPGSLSYYRMVNSPLVWLRAETI